jgi:hypothetical protein
MADNAGIYWVEDASLVYPDFKRQPASVLPYYHPTKADADGMAEPIYFERDGEKTQFVRVRYLTDDELKMSGSKRHRYTQPGGSGVHAYFSPQIDWRTLAADTASPIIITEGEKKALAACELGYPVIGLGGVFNFKDKADGNPLLTMLAEEFKWKGRLVCIVYDSDYKHNPAIRMAASKLAAELSLRYGANVRVVNIPDGPLDAKGKPAKQGLDDFLLAHGSQAFDELLDAAMEMRSADAEVLLLNSCLAYIECDDMIYDFKTRGFLSKGALLAGSDYSKDKVMTYDPSTNKMIERQLSRVWLTHENHISYRDTTLDPSTLERAIPRAEGGFSLNLWEGLPRPVQGDISPFMRLHDYVFQNCPDSDKQFAWNMLAWKVQNPHEIPRIAMVLIGPQGSGKSMWASIAQNMFGAHGKSIYSDTLLREFNAWMENALCVVIDEAEPEHVASGSRFLKKYIADKSVYMRDLYRTGREITNRAMFILTSNKLEVGNYDEDDRRMFVIGTPGPHPDKEAFYDPIGEWISDNGPAKLAYALQNYNLKGWRPPGRPPMTAEKRMAAAENRTPIERVGIAFREAQGHSVLLNTIDVAWNWCTNNADSTDHKIKTLATDTYRALGGWPIRSFYTPEELATILPEIVVKLGYATRGFKGTASGQISKELRKVGNHYLLCKDHPEGFLWRGTRNQYIVVSDHAELTAPISQADFERLMQNVQTYGELRLKTSSVQPLLVRKQGEKR